MGSLVLMGVVHISLLYFLPYAALGLGFIALHSAWAATLLYHAVIVTMWAWRRPAIRWQTHRQRGLSALLTGLCALCLPFILYLWPWMVRPGVEISQALDGYGVGGSTWWMFFGYIAIVHPGLEELYWRKLAPDHWGSDVAFAGFHVILVAPFITTPWIMAVVAILVGAGGVWRWTVRRTGGLGVVVLTHGVADFSILLAVHLLR